jgi:tRNA-Thr(GGU) m(6)t(6)A37 methyltransferase TsaA
MRTKFDSPHQPKNGSSERNCIELIPGLDLQTAVRDLEGFDRIWLIWWFHRNTSWKPLVLPPRGGAHRRGVLATRSPHRPNPIGITSVPLLEIHKLSIIVGNTDLVDGTPILDIKPYIASVDAFPDASQGWIEKVEETLSLAPQYLVSYSVLATEQLEWLRGEWNVDFASRASELLARDPSVHRTRRIRRLPSGLFMMGCGAWRLFFTVSGSVVEVAHITPGYPDRLLMNGPNETVPDQDAQIAFRNRWATLMSDSD